MTYDPNPRYPVVGGTIEHGFEPLVAELAETVPGVLAFEGPATIPWHELLTPLAELLRDRGLTVEVVDARTILVPWAEIQRRTTASALERDPVFGRIVERPFSSLVEHPVPESTSDAQTTIVFGPGSALHAHDVLWYADHPKWMSLERIRRGRAGNVGQPPGESGSEQRLLFVDWPLLDRHKQHLLPRIERYLDVTDPARTRSLAGEALRRSLRTVAESPFRVRPTFFPGPWGGQWLRRRLGIETDAPNLAWSYELITPESGILLGEDEPAEVGFELLMAAAGERVLGPELTARFGVSFPIRFDYLDTLDGGHLSIQCHPTERYMQDVFGLPYTQHETYYVVDTSAGATVLLGLRDDADVDEFEADAARAEAGVPFDPERYLQVHEAEQHRLYLIPGGTPHASGKGNLVLEISATPYLYTLRFYDWLRRNLAGELRPVHLAHAFANLDSSRRGEAVRRELIAEPEVTASGAGWVELRLGSHPDLFFVVDRLEFEDEIEQETRRRFHVLNLVAGEEVEIEWDKGHRHRLAYAETIVIPASVRRYALHRTRGPACKVVKAWVP